MSLGPNYNPIPPRVWSRVQSECTYLGNNSLDNSNSQALYEEQLFRKGNILQYKKNSSNLTKKQKYSQINKGLWCNRKKSWATQTDKYTNPNTDGFKRVNSVFYSYPNNLIGKPNNPAGPFVVNVQNPFDCSDNTVEDEGTLICNNFVDPCTGETIKKTKSLNCYPTTDSNVPGKIQFLCWNNRLQTYYPRQRYIMTNSGTKWPEGYKGFQSAVKNNPPILELTKNICSGGIQEIGIQWSYVNNQCLPISNFIIFKNNIAFAIVPFTTTTYEFSQEGCESMSLYVKAVSTTIESEPSNTIFIP
jgi:hypothetical protein